jgi:predicted AlkP superfamily pyrophosphatase or phosphodiesterase
MHLPFVRLACLLLLLSLAGCATRPDSPVRADPLLLISIDGLRAADVDAMPTLAQLGRDGVRAEALRPSYPSLTFPNHYSIVTGLRPDRHGIVHNTMQDPELGRFSLSKRDAVGDGRWWGGEPLWLGAKKAGLRSATMFWPGSEAAIQGIRPDYWQPFDGKVTPQARVDQVLAWLDLPEGERPTFLTLYFDQVDHEGHDHGPDSPQTMAARAQIDAALAHLQQGLRTRGLRERLNIVIVSDHGMAAVEPGHALAIEDMLPMEKADVVSGGQVVGVNPRNGREDEFVREVAPKLLGRHDRYQCWRKAELPPRWHYGTHPRIPAIVCQMDEGWDAITREGVARRANSGVRGSHGFDPALPSMQAAFIAHGPAFNNGVTLPAFDNVDVYPLLARLLRIAPAPNDGDIAPLLPALRP